MKVLFVASISPDVHDRDVIARRLVPLLEAVARRGIHLTVVLFGDEAGLAAPLRDAGIATQVLQPYLPPRAAGFRGMLPAILRLRRVIRDVAPDVVDGDEPLPAIATSVASFGSGCVRIYRRHHHGGRRRLHAASRLAAALAHWTVVSNEAMAQQAVASDRTPRGRILVATSGSVQPHPADPAEVRAIRDSLGVPDGGRLIGVVSRLREQKGIDLLIRALSLLTYSAPTHCFISGSGPEEAKLKALARDSKIPIHFVGHQDHVDQWLHAADVVVMPSRSESFGRVTVEAMACGRPLIAARVGGLTQAVVHDETGILVEPESETALARALDTLLAQNDLRTRLGAAARRRWEENYTIERMADSWVEAWKRSSPRQQP